MNINLDRKNLRNKPPQTLAQRFGFQDPDLTSPKHDALLLWLDENIERVMRNIMGDLNRVFYEKIYERVTAIGKEKLEEYDLSNLEEFPLGETIYATETIWEQPILNGNYTVGFCDMLVELRVSRENSKIIFDSNSKKIIKAEEQYENYSLWFEIKPEIRSLGELMRQIRMYQSYTEFQQWFVVSPDTRFRSPIEKQGIGFIEAPRKIE